jgi:thymidylate synthase
MIPVLKVEGKGIAEAWENSLIAVRDHGCQMKTQYDRPEDPPSLDSTMIIDIQDPLAEPMIHRDFPGGFEDLQEYVMEVVDGIKNHLVRDPNDPDDTRWEYTYNERLCKYTIPGTDTGVDQIESIAAKLAKSPYSRRAQAITWKVWEDNTCYDPACLQSIWCRITEDDGVNYLNTNVRFRSNDAYKAAFMNIYALTRLQERIATRITELSGKEVKVGRYCHIADSYHIYGSNFNEFENRFVKALDSRTFEQRTMNYDDVKDMMEEAIPAILKKVEDMSR